LNSRIGTLGTIEVMYQDPPQSHPFFETSGMFKHPTTHSLITIQKNTLFTKSNTNNLISPRGMRVDHELCERIVAFLPNQFLISAVLHRAAWASNFEAPASRRIETTSTRRQQH